MERHFFLLTILRWMGGGRYLVQTNSGPTGQQVLQRERLKYYRSPDPKTKVPLSYYSDRQLPPSDDTYNVEQVLDHRGSGPKKNYRKVDLCIAWMGHPDRTWEDIRKFVGRNNDRVEHYCRRHGLMKYLQ